MSTNPGRHSGFTLIELIVFIAIIGVGLAGVLLSLNTTTRASSDPLIEKQLLAIAESVLEEVTMQAFTWCDPDDPNAAMAATTANCSANAAEGGGKATYDNVVETRGSAVAPLDNVSDYDKEIISSAISGNSANWPAGYQASVSIGTDTLDNVPKSESLLIAVTASVGTQTLTLHGYRLRHSPNALP